MFHGSGIGILKIGLKTLSAINISFNYADNTSLFALDSSDVDITEEFNNSLKWADDNQMIINFNKSKEIVSQKCSPHRSLPSVLTGIERVVSAKLLGVIFSHNLKFDEHVEMFKLSVTYCNVKDSLLILLFSALRVFSMHTYVLLTYYMQSDL